MNGDFSQGTTGWTAPSSCFNIDPNTLAPDGAATLELSNPASCSAAIALNSVKVSGGAQYTISGQIKTEDFLGANKDLGAMFFLFDFNRSPVVNGTTDWTSATMQHVVVPAGKTASFRLITYGTVTTGNAWFANMSVQQEIRQGCRCFSCIRTTAD